MRDLTVRTLTISCCVALLSACGGGSAGSPPAPGGPAQPSAPGNPAQPSAPGDPLPPSEAPPATIPIPVDEAPLAVADAATVAEGGGAFSLDVLANDADADGGPRAVASTTQPQHGIAAIGPGGLSVTYTPGAGYCNAAPNAPADTFTYTLTPGGSSATVSVAVTCACGLHKPTAFVVGSSR